MGREQKPLVLFILQLVLLFLSFLGLSALYFQAPFEWLNLGYCCAMLLLQETAASSTSQRLPLVPLISSWARHGQTEMARCHFSAHLCRFLLLWADLKTYTALSIRHPNCHGVLLVLDIIIITTTG
ncbi:hypothetical protein LZ31DRAFT_293786 [Colletotrichum somersetense]|nr:hypothetical protein LZ31DRAFT_293786 [Colletotrichum somersetense]